MRFAEPEWLLLLPALLLLAWRMPELQLRRPLRAFTVGVALLALAGLQLQLLREGLELWVLVDRSASAESGMSGHLTEWESLLQRSATADDEVKIVDFAKEPLLRGEGDGSAFSAATNETRVGAAIRYALGKVSPDKAARMLLLTDGFSTEPIGDLSTTLAARAIPVDYRLVVPPKARDYQIANLEIAQRIQSEESFLVELVVTGSVDGAVPYRLSRDGAEVVRGVVQVQRGRGVVRLADRVAAIGGHRYVAQIMPAEDAHPGNNLAKRWVEVVGGPRVLLISAYNPDPVEAALRQSGLNVDRPPSLGALTVGSLAGAHAVILNNVAAWDLPSEFLAALPFYVRDQGGGLLITGGQHSFGSGGYFGSPISDLLPVSMELRQEHRTRAIAMAIALDRSGSMSVGVANGPTGLTKMDLANDGAAKAVELLGPADKVAVLAVDSEPHVIVPLMEVERNRPSVINSIRRINSNGGGIFVYEALKGAWEELRSANAEQKHIILFADAADAEQPDRYQEFIAGIRSARGTVSVIGLGTESDPDAGLLKDVAKLGGGRIFFSADPAQLPMLFAQETVSVARATFIDETMALTPTGGWMELSADRQLAWLPAVDGYNVNYLRPEATMGAVAKDEYKSPLLAFWQRGTGRVAAIAFPVAGALSQSVRSWSEYTKFIGTVTRWGMRGEAPTGIGLRARVIGSTVELSLLYDRSWEERLLRSGPTVVVDGKDAGAREQLVWERIRPGEFKATVALEDREQLRGAIQLGGEVLPFGPITAIDTAEWSFDRARVEEVRNLAHESGGAERLDLTKVWSAPRPERFGSARRYLLWMLVALVLLDAFLTRIGWRMPVISRQRFGDVLRRLPRDFRLFERRRRSAPPPPEPEVIEVPPAAAPEETARRDRFSRAKDPRK